MNTLKKNSTGEQVKILQAHLGLSVDGKFGPATESVVKEFQKSHNLVADGIVGPKTWEALGVTNPRYIDELIVHCSATPAGKDYTVDTIRDWHVKGNGWSDIGYHYVIYRDGSIHPGRNVNIAGAHTTNHNSRSIGICYIGGMDKNNKNPEDTRTPEQKEALVKLLRKLLKEYPGSTIHGHREYANKACPSFDAKAEYALLKPEEDIVENKEPERCEKCGGIKVKK